MFAGLGFNPNAPPKTQRPLTSWLTFGSKLELEYVDATHTTLHTEEVKDAATAFAPELSLAFSADPSQYFRAFLDVKLPGEIVHAAASDTSRVGFEVKEAFFLVRHLLAGRVAVQLGRQKFTDTREWLYDDELHAARLYDLFPKGKIELAVIREGLMKKDLL